MVVITIDGVPWSGKSTTASALSKLINYKYVNTGAMYASIAYKTFQIENNDIIIAVAMNINMDVDENNRLIVDGEDLTDVSTPSLLPRTQKVAQIPEIREIINDKIRTLAKNNDIIFEGRDMAFVLPNAEWKFFLESSVEIRIKRFLKIANEEEKQQYPTEEKIRQMIIDLENGEKNREIAPLTIPEDAIIYDNSLSPTPERDAVVLWHYIHHKDQILKNIDNLKNLKN